MPPKPVSPEEKTLDLFLTSIGLSSDEAHIYKTLTTHGQLTTLDLARKTGIPRTRVYRTLERLRTQKLVEEIIDEHRTLAQAVPPDRLEKLLKTKQDQVADLTRLFPQVQKYLDQQINRRQPDTKVKFYKGISGIQQMASNVLNAKNEIVGYTYLVWKSAVGETFATQFFEDMYLAKLKMREIYSDAYIESKGGLQNLSPPEVPKPFDSVFTSRYIPSSKLDIQVQSDVYNDVISYYSWQGDDIFGVEIYNPKVAAMQKQIFELLWNIAIPDSDLIKATSVT